MRAGRGAFTLLELVIVTALMTLIAAALYRFWVTSARLAHGVEEHTELVQRAQLVMRTLIQDVQQARRLVYPAPGAPAQAGVAVIKGDGSPVLWRLERGKLVKRDLATGVESVEDPDVLDLHCRVAEVPQGRDPDLVHIRLTLRGRAGQPFSLVTSARSRVLEVSCPADR